MSFDPEVLKEEILSAIDSMSDSDKADRDVFWTMLCTQILIHITTFGVVVTTGSATTQTGTIS